MNWFTVHPILPVRKGRHRIVPHLLAVLVALAVLIPRASTARADTICTLTASGPTCPTYPPPDLLNLHQGGLYAATPAQEASLQNLEDKAVSDIITIHNLADADADAVKSWARADAEAELYKLLLQAIDTSASSRTADQQNAVDWFTAVMQRQAVTAAEDAGLQYVKWAGLDQSKYQSLLNDGNTTTSDLQSFLSTSPDNYNNSNPSLATGGWCVYRSPAPYDTEYTGYNDVTCHNQCPTFCFPPTPSYDQFTKWGEADANYPLLSTGDYQSTAKSMALGLGLGVSLGVIYTTGAVLSYFAAGAASAASAWAGVGVSEAVTALDLAVGSISAVGAFATIAVVIAALVTAIIVGINVTDAANLPGKLATLIGGAETTPPDPASLESTTDGATTIYNLFVGATLPAPANRTCDNSGIDWEFIPLVANGVTTLIPNSPCLNLTDIPPAGGTDPQFLVQAKDSTTQTISPAITWKDAASGTTTTARLSENWFIEQANGAAVQTLRMTYTDWNGSEQTAWLLGDPTHGYAFLTLSTSTADPYTCLKDGTCSFSPSIDYSGPDGRDYSASVRGYTPPTGSPSYSTAVEASPVTFQANDFAPGGATAPITYTWQFQEAGCGISCISTVLPTGPGGIITGPPGPAYTDPVSGDTATYTWQTSGNYLVSLTATDAHGVQANDTFTVAVGDVPPTLQVSPTCGSITIVCTPQTGDVGTLMGLAGTVAHTGSLDNEIVTVNWGDGSSEDIAGIGPNSLSLAGNSLTLSPSSDGTHYTLTDTHTYTKPGAYTGTVWVYDWGGGTDNKTFTETIVGTQAINFPSLPAHTYGDAPFTISAIGGGSGKAVTFASTDPTVCTASGATSGVDGSGNGTGSATVTLLKLGACVITAGQGGSATYHPARSVTQSFTVQPAPLTVTASSASITYGDTAPAITPGYSGFVNNETSSALTTQATCAVAPNSGAAGTYQTTCSGAADHNYSVTYVPGTLTIKKAPLTVTANNQTMTYGAGVPTFDAGYGGLLNGDAGSVVSNLTCGAVDGSNTPVSGSTPAGTYSITCSGGSAANYALSYQPGTLTITKAATSVTLAAAPAAAVFGQPVTITASPAVTSPGAGHPGGTVEFKDGGTDIGGCAAQPVSAADETATCTTSALGVANHSLTASYSGDSNFTGSSTAAAVSQPVGKAATTITLAPVAPVTQGQQATFMAAVAATAPGAGTPTGTVTFYDGATSLGIGRLSIVNGTDQATFSAGGLAVGAHTITANYDGDGNFTTSTSAAATQNVDTNLSGYPKLPSGAYNLSNANLSGGYFVGVSLAGAGLANSNLTNAVFTGANLTGANLSNSNLKGANLSGANLSGATLTNSTLKGASGLTTATLTGAVWGNTTCPDGTVSNNDGGTCIGHL